MREGRVKCLSSAGFHHMAYVEWGDPGNPKVLVCVHGLTRCGRDFDFWRESLADRISGGLSGRGRARAQRLVARQVAVCPAAVLRGHDDPVGESDAESVHWVGTSMGGLIGMMLASQPDTPITRLVLNDVGPLMTVSSLQRIGEYLGNVRRSSRISGGRRLSSVSSRTVRQTERCAVAASDCARDACHSRRQGGVCLRSWTGPALP
jgi:pimeloyl-ACP methyl ester carboxylesterase